MPTATTLLAFSATAAALVLVRSHYVSGTVYLALGCAALLTGGPQRA